MHTATALGWPVESLIAGLDGLGLATKGFPSCVKYGIEREQDFIALIILDPKSIWLEVSKSGYSKLSPEYFTRWKREVNDVASCYKEDSLSEPSPKGALGPHYEALSGRVHALVKAISNIKTEIERAFAKSGERNLPQPGTSPLTHTAAAP
jgi:hypothetical protein